LPLPSHFEHRGGNIRRPGSLGCTTAKKPVPLQPEHSRSLIGSFGQPAQLPRIVGPPLNRLIIIEHPDIGVDDFSMGLTERWGVKGVPPRTPSGLPADAVGAVMGF
jgi:hypothetical protein